MKSQVLIYGVILMCVTTHQPDAPARDKSISDSSSLALRVSANFIDEHIFAKLDQLGIPPSELCTDGEFIRRASIDICGTLPTAEQVRQFLADKDPKKRERLVDQLLQRPEYSSYFALKWGDILRNRQRGLVKVGGGSGRTHGFHDWIRDGLEKNKPYDEFVRELLTASGAMYGKESHPAVGWFNVLQTPQTMVDDTSQIFLGTRIQCAQCHHHPYEKWSQDDYWGLASFFARLKLEKPKEKPPKQFNNSQTVLIADEGTLTNRQGKVYTNPRTLGGERPKDRPLHPNDVLATLYRHLGIDWTKAYPNNAGRPIPILTRGKAIEELL